LSWRKGFKDSRGQGVEGLWRRIGEYANLQIHEIEPPINLKLTEIIEYFTRTLESLAPRTLRITPTLLGMIQN